MMFQVVKYGRLYRYLLIQKQDQLQEFYFDLQDCDIPSDYFSVGQIVL